MTAQVLSRSHAIGGSAAVPAAPGVASPRGRFTLRILVHLSGKILCGGNGAPPPRLDGVSRRDGGGPTAWFRLIGSEMKVRPPSPRPSPRGRGRNIRRVFAMIVAVSADSGGPREWRKLGSVSRNDAVERMGSAAHRLRFGAPSRRTRARPSEPNGAVVRTPSANRRRAPHSQSHRSG